MNFILSHHAEEKIIQRQISLKILQEILNNPEQILEEDGLKVYQGTFVTINNKTYRLFRFLCGNEAYTDSFFGKIVVKVFLRQHFTIP